MNQKKSLLGYVMQVLMLKEKLYQSAEKGDLVKYVINNASEISRTIDFNKFELGRDTVSKFLQTNFIKNNFSELSDFVTDYFNKTRRF